LVGGKSLRRGVFKRGKLSDTKPVEKLEKSKENSQSGRSRYHFSGSKRIRQKKTPWSGWDWGQQIAGHNRQRDNWGGRERGGGTGDAQPDFIFWKKRRKKTGKRTGVFKRVGRLRRGKQGKKKISGRERGRASECNTYKTFK